GGADGAERVVGHEVDVMRLGHAGDLHRFGQPADVAHIDAGEVGNAALDKGQELPLAAELLADGEGDGGQLAQRVVRLGGLIADRLFEEVEGAGGHALAEGGSFGDGEAVVVVDAQHRLGADYLADLGQPIGGDGDRFAGLVDRT